MFDLNANDGSVRKQSFESPIPKAEQEGAQFTPPDRLDDPKHQTIFRQAMSLYVHEIDRQFESRAERAHDDDFYDNIQWDPDDERILNERGQKPIVYNVISASVDWICNTEKRSKADFKILPRRKEGGKPAERKTSLLKYLADVNHTHHGRSRAFEDAVISGLGWMEDGYASDDDGEPIYSRYVNWREMLHDSRLSQFDGEDGRFLFRSKWVDYDVGCATFEDRQQIVDLACSSAQVGFSADSYGDWAMDSAELESYGIASANAEYFGGYERRRFRAIEGWLKLPVKTRRLKGGTFNGELYDPHSAGHRWSYEGENGVAMDERVLMKTHVVIMTAAGLLWFSESPYRHNRFPYTPIWGKRRRRDGMPYGLVRGLKGQQEDINKRASKALYILSTNKIVMDSDALAPETDLEAFREEAARPDAILVKKRGTSLELKTDRDLSQYQLEIMSRSISMIQSASGVTDELLGRRTNASSGIAIQRRQDQGSMATAHFFENYRLAMQLQGEKQLSMIEQFIGEEKAFRITNSRGAPEFITVNDGLPENDIVRTKADYIISESDFNASMRQAAVDQIVDLVSKTGNPQVTMIVLDLIVESMDLPNRDEIVKRIRSLTGMKDPDATDEQPTPEDQAKAEQVQAQQQIQAEQTMLELGLMRAKIDKLLADAQKVRAQTGQTNVATHSTAMETAVAAISLPSAAVHVADRILAEATPQPDADAAGQVQQPATQPAQTEGTPPQPETAQPPAQQPMDAAPLPPTNGL